MKKTFLTDILQNFNKKEIRELGLFIGSKYYTRKRDLTKFYEILIKNRPNYSEESISRKVLYKKLKPEGIYDQKADSYMRMLFSEMLKLTEEYILSKELCKEKNKILKNNILTEYYIKNGLNRNALSCLNNSESVLDNSANEINSYYEILHHTNLLIKYYIYNNAQNKISSILSRTDEYSMLAYIYQSVLSLHDKEINKYMYNIDYDKNYYKEFFTKEYFEKIRKLHTRNTASGKITEVLTYLAEALLNPKDSKIYNKLKDEIYNNTNSIPIGIKSDIYNIFDTITIFRMHLINLDKYGKIHFDITEKRLNEGMILSGGNKYFPIILFIDYIHSGNTYRGTKWTENFIKTNISYIAPQSRENIYNYSMAHLNYFKKNYSEALRFISKTDYTFSEFVLELKQMQLKIYYEQGLYDESVTLSKSIKRVIKENKKIPAESKKSFSNFIKFYDLLIKAKKGKYFNFGKYFENLKSENTVYSKGWLGRKMELIYNQ
jgi:hypothetical protein